MCEGEPANIDGGLTDNEQPSSPGVRFSATPEEAQQSDFLTADRPDVCSNKEGMHRRLKKNGLRTICNAHFQVAPA